MRTLLSDYVLILLMCLVILLPILSFPGCLVPVIIGMVFNKENLAGVVSKRVRTQSYAGSDENKENISDELWQ